MKAIPFAKFHGFGNDYIVVQKRHLSGLAAGAFGRAICRRHVGAGADGIAILEKLDGGAADFHCDIINPDGSAAGFSGNGTRCAVSYLFHQRLWNKPELRLRTDSGIKNYRLLEFGKNGAFVFEAEIGKPKFSSAEIPFLSAASDAVLEQSLNIGGSDFAVSCVNVGNPVACVFVDDFAFDWRAVGRALEVHEKFPERTNVVFVKVLDTETIEIRIWERGAGETAASGTCSSGAAVVAARTGRTGRSLKVRSEGGISAVDWLETDLILLTGSAEFVYSGEWPAAAPLPISSETRS